jgi:type IV secretory pathway VirB3-like protein
MCCVLTRAYELLEYKLGALLVFVSEINPYVNLITLITHTLRRFTVTGEHTAKSFSTIGFTDANRSAPWSFFRAAASMNRTPAQKQAAAAFTDWPARDGHKLPVKFYSVL